MLAGILDYFRNGNAVIKKDDVSKVTDFIFTAINDEVIPSFNNLLANVDLDHVKNNQYIKQIGKLTGTGSNSKDILTKLKFSFTSFSENESVISKLVNKEIAEVITDRSLSCRDGAIIRMVTDLGSMTMYIMDFLDLITLNKSTTEYPKIHLKNIEDNISVFSEHYRIYGDSYKFKKLLSEINTVSDTTIDINSDVNMLRAILDKAKSITLPMSSGFINNPFYHIRMWMVDNEIKKYENLKDKRVLVELRLKELMLESDRSNDPKLRKQIEYYENKVARLSSEIAEIERR